MFISAIVVAAGKGRRMGTKLNKVFLKLNGKPVLYYTLNVFEKLSELNEIILVVSNEDIDYCRREIIDKYNFKKVKQIVAGGMERQESVFNGLKAVNSRCDIVMIHDGARPFIDEATLKKGIEESKHHSAVGIAVPVKDTIKVVDDDNFVVDTPDRTNLMAIQTPQIFEYRLIYEAHLKAMEDGFLGTDDTVLVERLGHKVKLVEGSYRNIKITTPEDLIISEAFLKTIYQ
ncbi:MULTISPECIES: 2-C-methyl-D-erythritol 4-phosphate cytidylyltransferase [unclassified Thermoanaerobacterium]|jgi:2-C-methyl-D-erythritol 4-phosphate cytidylyltransferase|uniref:2-C-methyl-D-erythritol 4-phosphate cytidylyltransferase n=1 Tax=unclassified Thermoanaerobacterium TaxID=2622527 RepID=UPI000A15BA29|nr:MULTISPECIES: 2-C-methyl-D-erythritol 4-phosphate cytidylyltransferase [unclassified Thermoanaerobacterium]MDE4543346.1 2-C-methyl-D-erythritol 4-phosphate cytidylyltransferase [Thermoanaerobacterium sp. R66]ORX23256.1 2-C-methyl-D-erythritol 4-phosphate cytidylyltransferase [Thermoanaerobacterium sp. PSU-2]HHV75297.1 2-C-methyl-D-erythritol 4-phosphate cytidylyltransferase [Thermoanaerobacterium sp.]